MRSYSWIPAPLTALAICIAIYLIGCAVILPMYQAIPDNWHLVDEYGPVQTLSWNLWATTAIGDLVVAARRQAHRVDWLAAAFLMLYLAARELDTQKEFTTWNLAHLPSYFDPHIPLGERVAAMFLYRLPPPLAFLWLLSRWGRTWIGGLRLRKDWALGLLAWFGIGVACAAIDKMPHFVDIADAHRWITNTIEEVLELVFALYGLLLTAWAWRENHEPPARTPA